MVKNKPQNKARYWTAVLYPENMVEGWQDNIGDTIQLPYVYCIHDKDKTSKGEEDRKEHIHIGVVFPNTTTFNHALSVFQLLDSKCVYCERIVNIRHFYDYLIHETEDAKKAGKYQYDKSERISGNSFDIGAFEQISTLEKRELVAKMAKDITAYKFENFLDFYEFEIEEAGENIMAVLECLQVNSGFFERLTRGAYLRHEKAYKKAYYRQMAGYNTIDEVDEETGEVCNNLSAEPEGSTY